MLEKIKKHKFAISIIFISLIYLILTSVQNPNFYYYSGADDYLVLHEAKSILDFKWLGHFWGRTLSKGPGAAIFIAISNFIGISFIKAQFLFYIGAVILFVHTLKKVIKSDFLRIIVFIVVLFNPIMYDVNLLRVYRDSINSSLLLYVVSCCFGIFFNYREEKKKIIPYMIGLGIFGSWMAITREETIWISPFTIGSGVITSLFIIFDKECKDKLKKVLLYLIPICIYIVVILGICTLNKIAYGEFVRIEQNTKAYKDFQKAVSSVDVENPILKVDVTTEAREKLYEVSPSFSELKDHLETDDSTRSFKTYGTIPNEIENGWFMWAIFGALDDKEEYSQNLKTLNDYFRKTTAEINEAYDDGRLKKEDNPVSIFDKENMNLLFENLKKTFDFQVNLKDNNLVNEIDTFVDKENPDILEERKAEFYEIAGCSPTNELTYNYKIDKIKIGILNTISKIYQKLSKPIFLIGLVIYCLMLLRFFVIKPRFENYKELIVLTSLLLLYFIRLLVISYVETKLCPAINTSYLSSTYSLQFAFEVLSLIFGITGITKFIKNRK